GKFPEFPVFLPSLANYLPSLASDLASFFSNDWLSNHWGTTLPDRPLQGVRYGETIMPYITQRKKAEPVFKRHEDKNRLLVEQVVDYSIFMLNETGHIISW